MEQPLSTSSPSYPPGFSPKSSINLPSPPLLEEGELRPEFKPGSSGGEPSDRDNRIFSLFVDNIPAGKNSTWLYNLFKTFGRIVDIYIPGHKSRASNMAYGFVRFVTKASALLAISQMDGYWAGRNNLAVKEAIYNKWCGENHSRPHTAVRPLFTLSGQKDPLLFAKDRTISHSGLGGTKGHSHNHRSYAQVTAGVAMEDIGGDVPVKKLIVYGQPSSTDWLNNCVIAKCPSNPGVIISSDMLSNSFKGLKKTMYWGGRKVLMEFCSKKDLDEAVAESVWKSVFVEFYPWNGEMVNLERLVWIECAHLPISVWNQNTFSEIAGLWGSLVAVNDDTLNQRDLSSAKLLIETEAQVISASFEVSVDGSLFMVDVREVAGISDSQPLRSGRSITGPESRVPEVQKVHTEPTSLKDIVLRKSPASIRPEVAVTKSGNPEPSASSCMLSDFLDEEEDRVDMLSLKEAILCNQIIIRLPLD